MFQRQRGCDLSLLDEPLDRRINASVHRFVEMVRAEEIGDFFEGVVVGQDGAQQRRLDLRVMRRDAVRDIAVVRVAVERREGRIGRCLSHAAT